MHEILYRRLPHPSCPWAPQHSVCKVADKVMSHFLSEERGAQKGKIASGGYTAKMLAASVGFKHPKVPHPRNSSHWGEKSSQGSIVSKSLLNILSIVSKIVPLIFQILCFLFFFKIFLMRTILKVFTEFVTVLLLFHILDVWL